MVITGLVTTDMVITGIVVTPTIVVGIAGKKGYSRAVGAKPLY
jgi:hypothetical protein